MRMVTVYRVDYDRKSKYPIGVVLERRERERRHNYQDMLRLARRLFALDPFRGNGGDQGSELPASAPSVAGAWPFLKTA